MRWPALFSSLLLLQAQKIIKQRVYGGSMADVAVRAFADSLGYWLIGHTTSQDGILKRKGYNSDFWVVRIDKEGELLWQATYGGKGDEELTDALVLPDGGLVLVGWSNSSEISHGKKDAFIVCTDPLGKVRWQRCIGGKGNDMAQGVALHEGGSLWVVGQIGSQDSILNPNPLGGVDGWLLCFSLQGELLFHGVFGGSGNDYLRLVVPFSADTLWLIGASDSQDGHIQNPLGKMDIWLVETDKKGSFHRSWNIGGSDFEEPYSWVRSPQGEIWVAGTSFSPEVAAYGRADGVIWRIQPEGMAHAAWSGGGNGDEGLNFLRMTAEGDWLLAGMTSSRTGLIPSLAGLYDGWVIRWRYQSDSLIFCYTFGGKDVDSWIAVFPYEGVYVGIGTTASPGEQLGIRTYGSADYWVVWWTPDTTPVMNLSAYAPTILTGYVLTENKGTPFQLFFRDAKGQIIDSLMGDSTGFFRWRVPDTLSGEIRLSVHAPSHVWKELGLSPRRGKENRIGIYLEKLRIGIVLPLFYGQLEELARFLRLNPRVRLELAGHTDGTSLPESEIQLSRARAQAVRDYLVGRGIPKERFSIVGYGKARPIADNATPEGQQKNRRVEFRILSW
ncbi:MAG: OmpA family protein [Bacteroidia bacterium]|nr:OmpA family protein [Bacteroidia bacterium]MDW8133716.1 OmpA family protein [Bacteroidia bacterium]